MIKILKPDGEVLKVDSRRHIDDVGLTAKAVKHWQKYHNEKIFGYVSFEGFAARDILSVISASRQGAVRLGKSGDYVDSYKITG